MAFSLPLAAKTAIPPVNAPGDSGNEQPRYQTFSTVSLGRAGSVAGVWGSLGNTFLHVLYNASPNVQHCCMARVTML